MKQTVLVDEEGNELEQPTKGKRGPKPGSTRGSKSSFAAEEIAGDISNVFGAILGLLGRDNVYTEDDFATEAKGIKSACEKFEPLGKAWLLIKWASVPIGLFKKFINAPKSQKPAAEDVQNEQPTNGNTQIRAIR